MIADPTGERDCGVPGAGSGEAVPTEHFESSEQAAAAPPGTRDEEALPDDLDRVLPDSDDPDTIALRRLISIC